jgi:hypothetical protein
MDEMRLLFTILLVVFTGAPLLYGQTQINSVDEDEETQLEKNHELSIGAGLKTNGFEIFVEKGKILDRKNTRLFQIDFISIRHPKEVKQKPVDFYQISGLLDNQKDYYFGKQNGFFAFRFGYGRKKMIADKADKSGVRVSIKYLGGVSLGLLKPYYLEYIDSIYRTNDRTVFEFKNDKYREGVNDDKFLNNRAITSASGFSHGLDEIEPVPGVYGKFGLNFDWAANNEFVTALEAGVEGQLYYKKVPIMINSMNKPYFLSAYIAFQFGKRWYK